MFTVEKKLTLKPCQTLLSWGKNKKIGAFSDQNQGHNCFYIIITDKLSRQSINFNAKPGDIYDTILAAFADKENFFIDIEHVSESAAKYNLTTSKFPPHYLQKRV